MATNRSDKLPDNVKILLEMRPALDGHAGIPQETRLLFRGLSTLEGLQVEGLLQSSNRVIARGTPSPDSGAYRRLSIDQRIHKLSRVVVSLRASEGARLTERLGEALPSVPVQIVNYPPSLAAYLGPSMIGVMVYEGTY